jgi:predicted nuclease of predicted toxin-antitoxin system
LLKLLVDENLSPLTVGFLRGKGFDVLSIEEVCKGSSDEEISEIARRENRIIVTFDLDFGEIFFMKGVSVIVLRIRSRKPDMINHFLEACISKLRTENLDPYGKLIVVSEGKIRIRPWNDA